MRKGRYQKKKETSPISMILAVAVVLVVAMLVYFAVSKDTAPSGEKPESTGATDTLDQNQDPQNETTGQTAPSTAPEQTQATEQTTTPTETEPVTEPTVVIIQRAEAEYEKWLAAAQIVCVSMAYPDFQLEGVYAASATSLEDKFSSDGAYIIFTSGGSRIAIHSKAREGERADAGTVDISTEVIGYATFDKVDPNSVDVSAMDELKLEDLSELISQSLLVSIYTH